MKLKTGSSRSFTAEAEVDFLSGDDTHTVDILVTVKRNVLVKAYVFIIVSTMCTCTTISRETDYHRLNDFFLKGLWILFYSR